MNYLFGNNFVAVANTLDDRMQDIDNIIDKYLKPFTPKVQNQKHQHNKRNQMSKKNKIKKKFKLC